MKEEKSKFRREKAWNRGIELAKEQGVDLVMATEQNCNRVGVDVRTTSEEYAMLIGNQIGEMLTNYIMESQKAEDKLKDNDVLIKIIVTS